MTSPPEIWVCAAHHAAFRSGGWASLCDDQGNLTGAAGGERNTTASRMALAGLVSALRRLPANPAPSTSALVRVRTNSPDLAGAAAILAGRAQPEEDLDLWAQIATAAKTWRLELARAGAAPNNPIGFAEAWANLAMDKARATGAFNAAIPKANLIKAPGLASR